MQNNFSCPICSHNNWEKVQEFIYKNKDSFKKSHPLQDKFLPKLRKIPRVLFLLIFKRPFPQKVYAKRLLMAEIFRLEILFEVWVKNYDKIVLTTQFCKHCGFMTYSPRPDNKDLQNKYEYLNKNERHKSDRKKQLETKEYLNSKEIKSVFNLIQPYLSDKKCRVLDLGGAEGRYLLPFMREGHTCELIDFYDEPLPGVKKIANEIDEIKSDIRYDIILCIATLEHLFDPLDTVKKIYEHLNDEGIAYMEVPNEIFGTITKFGADPTTHINFFTPQSFQNMLKIAEFENVGTNPDKQSSIWVIARKSNKKTLSTDKYLISDVYKYLYPSRKMILNRIFGRIKNHL